MPRRSPALLPLLLLAAGPAFAAGDYPLASCKGWNGTLTDISGQDTRRARMEGVLARGDFREYCERDPGGETLAYGGTLSVEACIGKYETEAGDTRMSAEANCRSGEIVSRLTGFDTRRLRFPLPPDADTSCASGVPPVAAQFRLMCPAAAGRLGVE